MKKVTSWWEKQQGRLTKKQHIVIAGLTIIIPVIIIFLIPEEEPKTALNYFIPFFIASTGANFSLNAVFKKNYKKVKEKNTS